MKHHNYPFTKKQPVTEVLHGTELTDDYRWLEDSSDLAVKLWDTAQNEFTQSFLAHQPKSILQQEFHEILDVETFGVFYPFANRYFHFRKKTHENHSVLYCREGFSGDDKAVLDPNRFSEDGTSALDWWYPSPEGRLIAYGKSECGSELSTLYVVDILTGEHLPDVIPYTRYSSVVWLKDRSGFYYTRYPIPGTVASGDECYFKKAYFHKLGTPWQDDPCIFDEVARGDMMHLSASEDHEFLLLFVEKGWTQTDVYYRPLASEGKVAPFIIGLDAKFSVRILHGFAYVLTNHDAPRYHIIKIDLRQPKRWRELVVEGSDTIQDFRMVGKRIFVLYSHEATSQLAMFDLDGELLKEIRLPEMGTILQMSGQQSGSELFFSMESFTLPTAIFCYNIHQNRLEKVLESQIPMDLSDIETKQVFYTSRDGTRVSMFLVQQKNLVRDSSHPCVLHGYGGFCVDKMPIFTEYVLPFVKRGGVYAVANLRGGGEYGEEWHRAGRLHNKQNCFDDFICAAEWLIRNEYTTSKKLAVLGRSNGGLLVGAVVTQAPQLFRAGISSVPLLDMIRFPYFLIAKLWTNEYGDPEKKEDFAYLLRYSPYHNVQGVDYPALFINAAEADSRVHPMHARKMAALLQEKNTSPYPILFYIETKAGHGQGKPIKKVIEEWVLEWSFLFQQLEITIDI